MIYSTYDVHPRERLSYWLEVATRGYVEHDFETGSGLTFAGNVEITSLPGVGLSVFEADAHRTMRTPRAVGHDADDDLLLSALCGGKITVFQDGRETPIEGNALYLVDPTRPFELALRERSKHVIAKVPRSMIEARIGNTSDLTARSISGTDGIGALALHFFDMLPHHAESLDGVAGLKIAEQVLDLAALAFTSGHDRRVALSSPRATALLRLKATVERLLIEPSAKPERIAAETGISVRYANSLLAEEGWSIERYLTERRLERCRASLEDAKQLHRSIGEIAFNWGFSDLSHFGRRFKQRYGLSPTDYRRQVGLDQPATETRRPAAAVSTATRSRRPVDQLV